jgi:DNA-binding CsgD family transcriptional regulator
MKLVKLICSISIFSLSYSNILLSSTFQLDSIDYSSIDSIVKYKQTYPKKALAFGFDSLKSFSEDDELTLEFVNTNYYIGETFYHLQDYVSSYEYLKKSLELYELLDKRKRRNRKVSKPPWILTVMGAVYYKNKDYDNAIKFYNEAIENFLLFDPQYEDEKIYGLNTTQESLALIEIEKGNFDNAEKLYNLTLSRKDNNIGKMYSYRLFMELYILSNRLNNAEYYYNKVKSSFEDKVRANRPEFGLYFGEANLIFGKYFKDNLNFNLAYEYLLEAKEIFSELNIDKSVELVNYEIADLLISNNQLNEAEDLILNSIDYNNSRNSEKIRFYKLLEKVYSMTNQTDLLIASKDSIIAYNENPFQLEIQNEFNLLENLLIVSDKQNELNISKSRTSLIILISIFSSVTLLLLILFLRNNVELQRQKNYKLKYEKSLIKNELKLKKRELFSKINFISQRNEHINNIKDKISKNGNDSSYIKNLENEIKHLNTSNKAYKEFDKMFSQVYPNFYKNLNSKYKLSQTDIRLASYIKMNHNNHEISRISGISMRTVESQRYRLSKKLNLNKGIDLNSFILNL